MTHKPIRLIDLSLSFPHKTCFTGFNVTAPYGSRIAIIGRNGSGKSTLLKMLQGLRDVDGTIIMPPEYRIGHVPQIVDEFETSSGGERFNKSLTQALSNNPSLLLLDEPTNHLDRSNRKSLLRLLRAYTGTLIVASHDIELIRNVTCQLWHIDQNKVRVFSGNIDDLYSEIRAKRSAIERKLSSLKQ
jgi:ATPase subunit of ABC transporter with duplicated ATPase domains